MNIEWKIHQLHVVTARHLSRRFDAVAGGMVCHLKMILYGLQQASRVWNKKLDKVLRVISRDQSEINSNVDFLINGLKILDLAEQILRMRVGL